MKFCNGNLNSSGINGNEVHSKILIERFIKHVKERFLIDKFAQINKNINQCRRNKLRTIIPVLKLIGVEESYKPKYAKQSFSIFVYSLKKLSDSFWYFALNVPCGSYLLKIISQSFGFLSCKNFITLRTPSFCLSEQGAHSLLMASGMASVTRALIFL